MARFQCSPIRVIFSLLLFLGQSRAGVPVGPNARQGPPRELGIAEVLQQAEAGDPEAQYQLGLRYQDGHGVTHDDAEALKWWRKAAAQGHPLSQLAVGTFYREGRGGLAKSPEEAVAWFRKAANKGNAWGQAELALMYETGEGVPQDNAEAVRLYTRAADQGLPIAIFDLAYMYENGKGVSADSEKAVKLYELSAISVPTARRNLAILYSEGQGTVRKDPIVAYKWGLLAVSSEFQRILHQATTEIDPEPRLGRAVILVKDISKGLSKSERKAGRRLAEEWIKANANLLGDEPREFADATKHLE